MYSGLLILTGLLTFVAAEKLFSVLESINENSTKLIDINKERTNNNNKSPIHIKTDENANNKKHVSMRFFFVDL